MTIDTKELRRLAEEVRDNQDVWANWSLGDDRCEVTDDDGVPVAFVEDYDDAKYIAAADPATVLALLDERDALQAKVERVNAVASSLEPPPGGEMVPACVDEHAATGERWRIAEVLRAALNGDES